MSVQPDLILNNKKEKLSSFDNKHSTSSASSQDSEECTVLVDYMLEISQSLRQVPLKTILSVFTNINAALQLLMIKLSENGNNKNNNKNNLSFINPQQNSSQNFDNIENKGQDLSKGGDVINNPNYPLPSGNNPSSLKHIHVINTIEIVKDRMLETTNAIEELIEMLKGLQINTATTLDKFVKKQQHLNVMINVPMNNDNDTTDISLTSNINVHEKSSNSSLSSKVFKESNIGMNSINDFESTHKQAEDTFDMLDDPEIVFNTLSNHDGNVVEGNIITNSDNLNEVMDKVYKEPDVAVRIPRTDLIFVLYTFLYHNYYPLTLTYIH